MCMKKKAPAPVNYKTKRKTRDWEPSGATEEEPETMRTNIVMETPLVNEAQAITGIKTKTGVIHYALNEIVRRKKMKEILEFQGKVDFWDGYEAQMAGAK